MSLMQHKFFLPAVILIAGIGIAGLIYVQKTEESPVKSSVIETANASGEADSVDSGKITPVLKVHVLGDPNAPVTMIEYSSLSCPHCADFHREILPQLKKDYIDTGKVKLELREFPLNDAAALGTLLVRCAPEDKYFPLMDMLFAQQRKWLGAKDKLLDELKTLGGFAGLSTDTMDKCFDDNDLFIKIKSQIPVWKEASNINAVPTLIIGDKRIEGTYPYDVYKDAIESALK